MNLTPQDIARVAHEANRALQLALANPAIAISKPWPEASDEVQESAVRGVKALLQRPTTTASDSHREWVAFKVSRGWVFGSVKSEEKKTHPDLVPYELLPEAERAKDDLFVAVVNALRPYCARVEAPEMEAGAS